MTYYDANRARDMEAARLFRHTLRADVDDAIARLLRAGCAQAEIARQLCVSEKRVRRVALERAP